MLFASAAKVEVTKVAFSQRMFQRKSYTNIYRKNKSRMMEDIRLHVETVDNAL